MISRRQTAEGSVGFPWATHWLENYGPFRQEIRAQLERASRLEVENRCIALDYTLGDSDPPILNPTLGRFLNAKTIKRYFRRFRPEFGNPLHIELVHSLEYLNAYHEIALDD